MSRSSYFPSFSSNLRLLGSSKKFRIAFSFPISDEAQFFAHYDVLTQRPPTGNRLEPVDYLFMADRVGATLNNPNLKSEKTVDYELGFAKTLSLKSALKISAFYKFKYGWLLVGYAIKKSGFSLDDQMGESGSPLIRDMIKEQLDGAGINLASDEHVVVEINPKDDYKIDNKHRALVLR